MSLKGRPVTEKERDQMVKLYLSGYSITAIGENLGRGRDIVRRHLKLAGVHSMDRSAMDAATSGKLNPGKIVPDPKASVDPQQAAKHKRFVVTCALNDCPINQQFFQSLLRYCEAYQAQLLVIPVAYKNPNLFTSPNYVPSWPSELDPYWVVGDVELSSNIVIMGSMRIQATAARPLQGTGGISKGRSAVFGHPRVALETVPTPLTKYPLVYLTTGSISLPQYSETKAGRLGEFHHTISAAIIETDGTSFWWRHAQAASDGTFTDFERRWTPNGPEAADPALSIVMGDIHVGFDDKAVVRAVLGEVARDTGARSIILHDILDFFSDSHHHRTNTVLKVLKDARGRSSVFEEIKAVARWLEEELPKSTVAYVIRSNHHDHLDRWLDSPAGPIEPKNLYLWHKLNAERLREAMELAENDPDGDEWHVSGALELALREVLPPDVLERVVFHDDRRPLEFAGIDVSNHGDSGPNGARGSRAVFARVQRRTFIAHSHTPGITDGSYQVGMSCRPDMPYMSGYSGWLAVSGIIYADGQRTLFPIINGKARM